MYLSVEAVRGGCVGIGDGGRDKTARDRDRDRSSLLRRRVLSSPLTRRAKERGSNPSYGPQPGGGPHRDTGWCVAGPWASDPVLLGLYSRADT
ncbi:hypothetical protein SKAU_G00206960 [Synaphobranchus kaupii]|uniref:Uncharacterized protein n=1 Tax=Synaphobranchus kaupii TaxID=118154 RepID=A0A9Q1F858_SYNKA|nr:hypothetical protein SKAU_G00206960 [Synaphobranchus kaupii]